MSFILSWKCFPSLWPPFLNIYWCVLLPFPHPESGWEDGQAVSVETTEGGRDRERGRAFKGDESGDVGCVKMGGWCFVVLPIRRCRSCWGCWRWSSCRLAAGRLCEAASSRLSCPGHVPLRSYGSSSWERSLEWLRGRRDTKEKFLRSWKRFRLNYLLHKSAVNQIL